MRLLKAKVQNFGSYRNLEIDYVNLGLTLLHGATGAGKSTFQDIPCWILYGITAKNGAADDVRNWSSDAITRGELELEELTVVRERGRPGQNDLYWIENNTQQICRGKDAKETQKFLVDRLGCSQELYLATAYYSEFSPCSNFFMATAVQRRDLLDTIACLHLPTALASKASAAKSKSRGAYTLSSEQHSGRCAQLAQCTRILEQTTKASKEWEETQRAEIEAYEQKSQNFEQEKAKRIEDLNTKLKEFEEKRLGTLEILAQHMEYLDTKIEPWEDFIQQLQWIESSFKCHECGGVAPKMKERHSLLLKEQKENDQLIQNFETAKAQYLVEQSKPNPYDNQIAIAKEASNTYSEAIVSLKGKKNPHDTQLVSIEKDSKTLKSKISADETEIARLKRRTSDLTQVYDIAVASRGRMFQSACSEIEQNTNSLLSKHFEAEIKVAFAMTDSDSIDVKVFKDTHECSYRQLSKGQRQLLKLCFSLSAMKVASQRSGVNFNILMLDEALDGLDAELKLKAHTLMEELQKSYETIFIIEHNTEFKSMISNQIEVTLENGESTLHCG